MSRKKIDKSVLAISEAKRIVDKQYRASFKDSICLASRDGTNVCGRPAVGAHINDGEFSGFGQKASDDLIWPLCDECHRSQHDNPGADWWLKNVLKPMARRKYRDWKKCEQPF